MNSSKDFFYAAGGVLCLTAAVAGTLYCRQKLAESRINFCRENGYRLPAGAIRNYYYQGQPVGFLGNNTTNDPLMGIIS